MPETGVELEGDGMSQPKMVKCVVCGEKYAYVKRRSYPGKSPKRCVGCQLEYVRQSEGGFGVGNATRRPGGHKTRQQHKRVFAPTH